MTDASDSVVLHLPVQGPSSAVKDLPGAPLCWNPPKADWKFRAFAVGSFTTTRYGGKSANSRRFSFKRRRGSGKGGVGGRSLQAGCITFHNLSLETGDTLSAPPALKGSYAKFTKALSSVVSSSQTTVRGWIRHPASWSSYRCSFARRTANPKRSLSGGLAAFTPLSPMRRRLRI